MTHIVVVPGVDSWEWGPARVGHGGGYQGQCGTGPFEFTVSAERKFDNSWQLHGSVKLGGVRVATDTWTAADNLRCTPEGIYREVVQRGVLPRLADEARRYVDRAAALVREFDAESHHDPE